MRQNSLQSNEEEVEVFHEEDPKLDDDGISPYVRLYFKVGGYFKWSWHEYRQTPWFVIKQLSKLLDQKQEDMNSFLGYEEAAMFKNLKRMFPSK